MRRSTDIVRACVQCGVNFYAYLFNVKRGWGLYCSKACRSEAERISPAEQVARHADRGAGPHACWPWTGTVTATGYGVFGGRGNQRKAHRAAWEVAWGSSIPEGLVVRHLCHNRRCCNPAHLDVGTHQDNVNDTVAAGRQGRGERQWKAKLTATDVTQIRRLRASGHSFQAIAKKFLVYASTIRNVVNGVTWKHVQ